MMKIVLNRDFGGFHLGEEFCKEYNYENPWCWDDGRTDKKLVDWVEHHPNDNPDLRVINIPDEATDWQIHDYDGLESIIAVLNGKIVWL